jgi:hypothetical protein
LNKKVFNKRFDKWDISVCNDNYTNQDEIFDCKIWIVILLNKSCEVIDERERCMKILDSIKFINKYNNSIQDFNKYKHYINN